MMASVSRLERLHADLLAVLDLGIDQTCDPALLERSAPAVSGWSVKDHMEHLSVANDGITKWIGRAVTGDVELDTGGSPTLVGRVALLLGWIPRGRAQAPERTRPKGRSAEELEASWRGTRARVDELKGSIPGLLASKATRNHFIFGNLNAVQWLRFMEIHNHHHQKIIRDIVSAR